MRRFVLSVVRVMISGTSIMSTCRSPRSSVESVERTTEILLEVLNSHNRRRCSNESARSYRPSSSFEVDEQSVDKQCSSALESEFSANRPSSEFARDINFLENISGTRRRSLPGGDGAYRKYPALKLDPAFSARQSSEPFGGAASAEAEVAIAKAQVRSSHRRSSGANESLQIPRSPSLQIQSTVHRLNKCSQMLTGGSNKPKSTAPTSARSDRDQDFLRSIAPLPVCDGPLQSKRHSSVCLDSSAQSSRGPAAPPTSDRPCCGAQAARPVQERRRRRLWERLTGCLRGGQD